MNVRKAKIRDGYGENAEDGVFAHVERVNNPPPVEAGACQIG